jgi:pilus assembly protein Flp/PilA
MKFLNNHRGQSLIEYLVIVSLVAVGSIFVMKSLGQSVQVRFANITNALQNKETNIQPDVVEATQYKKRNLDDFFKERPSAQ